MDTDRSSLTFQRVPLCRSSGCDVSRGGKRGPADGPLGEGEAIRRARQDEHLCKARSSLARLLVQSMLNTRSLFSTARTLRTTLTSARPTPSYSSHPILTRSLSMTQHGATSVNEAKAKAIARDFRT